MNSPTPTYQLRIVETRGNIASHLHDRLPSRKQVAGVMNPGESFHDCYGAVRSTDGYAPLHDTAIQSIYELVLQAGDIAIDGGAHAGKHAIPMARAVGPKGSVLAFEPLIEARTRLLSAVADEDLVQVQVFDSALSDVADHEVSFLYFPRRPGISSFLRRDGVPDLISEPRTTITTTIDRNVPMDLIRFLKLDVEGAEMLALAGAEATLQRSRPVVVVEAGTVSWRPFGYEAADLHFWCAIRSYRCYDLVGNDVTDRRSIEASFSAAGVWDYVLVPNESRLRDDILAALSLHRDRFIPPSI